MKTNYFEEAPGVRSIMRVVFFIFCLYAVVQSAIVFHSTGYIAGMVTFGSLSGVAIGMKLGQKAMEPKGDNTGNPSQPQTP